MEQSIQSEIIKCENQYWKAMGDNDVDKAISLTRFPCTISGPQGFRQVTEEEYRRLMKANDGSQYKNIELQHPQVEIMSDETAVITYEVNVNGKKMFDTSLWLKNENKWICGYHSEFPNLLN